MYFLSWLGVPLFAFVMLVAGLVLAATRGLSGESVLPVSVVGTGTFLVALAMVAPYADASQGYETLVYSTMQPTVLLYGAAAFSSLYVLQEGMDRLEATAGALPGGPGPPRGPGARGRTGCGPPGRGHGGIQAFRPHGEQYPRPDGSREAALHAWRISLRTGVAQLRVDVLPRHRRYSRVGGPPRTQEGRGEALMLAWGPLIIAATFDQPRFGYYLSVVCAIGAGYLGSRAAGLVDGVAGFLVGDEEESYRIARDTRARYVVTGQAMTSSIFQPILVWANEPTGDYLYRSGGGYGYTRKFYRTTLARLHLGDGADYGVYGERVPSIKHFRLVYESSTTVAGFGDRPIKRVKVFEVVPGAEVTGRAPDGTAAVARVRVRTNRGRTFTYEQVAEAKDGTVSLTLPYPTEGETYPMKATGPYELVVMNASIPLSVSGEDVRTGERINLAYGHAP